MGMVKELMSEAKKSEMRAAQDHMHKALEWAGKGDNYWANRQLEWAIDCYRGATGKEIELPRVRSGDDFWASACKVLPAINIFLEEGSMDTRSQAYLEEVTSVCLDASTYYLARDNEQLSRKYLHIADTLTGENGIILPNWELRSYARLKEGRITTDERVMWGKVKTSAYTPQGTGMV